MKNIIKYTIILCATLLLIACQNKSFTNEEANSLAEKFITTVNEGNYEQAFAMVEPDFFSARPMDRWITYYDEIKKVMGPVVSVKLTQHLSDDRLSGRFYMYQFSIKHENGFTKEMVTMIQKINSDAPLKIAGHKIDSSKLMKLNDTFQ